MPATVFHVLLRRMQIRFQPLKKPGLPSLSYVVYFPEPRNYGNGALQQVPVTGRLICFLSLDLPKFSRVLRPVLKESYGGKLPQVNKSL